MEPVPRQLSCLSTAKALCASITPARSRKRNWPRESRGSSRNDKSSGRFELPVVQPVRPISVVLFQRLNQRVDRRESGVNLLQLHLLRFGPPITPDVHRHFLREHSIK